MADSLWLVLVLGAVVVPIIASLKRRRWWVWLLVSLFASPLVAFVLLLLLPPPGSLGRSGEPRAGASLRFVPIFWGVLWLALAAFVLVRWWPNLWLRFLSFWLVVMGLGAVRFGLFGSRRALDELQRPGGPINPETRLEVDRFR